MHVLTRHLALILSLVGQLSDSLGLLCQNLVAWTEVDPSAEDQVYFAEQAD